MSCWLLPALRWGYFCILLFPLSNGYFLTRRWFPQLHLVPLWVYPVQPIYQLSNMPSIHLLMQNDAYQFIHGRLHTGGNPSLRLRQGRIGRLVHHPVLQAFQHCPHHPQCVLFQHCGQYGHSHSVRVHWISNRVHSKNSVFWHSTALLCLFFSIHIGAHMGH